MEDRERGRGQGRGQEYVQHPLVKPRTVEYREYQVNIARAAYGRNALVVLPTALGKTVISALVVAEVLYRRRGSRVLVMAPTRPLVAQHMRSFRSILKLGEGDAAMLTGRTPPEDRVAVWRGGARIVFSTPEVVRNDALEGRLDLGSFALLVFDEAHRAVKEYAYTEIAREYVSRSAYPMILAMTASPGANPERMEEVCRNLYVEALEYRDEEDPDVRPYVHPVDVRWRRVRLPPIYEEISSMIHSMLRRRVERLRAMGARVDPEHVTRRALIELGEELRYALEAESVEEERSRLFEVLMNQSVALTLFHMLELAETQGIHTLRAFVDRMEEDDKRTHAILMGDPGFAALRELVRSVDAEHPKLLELRDLVSAQLSSNPSSRILVFTQYRDTVAHAAEVLAGVPGVRVGTFVGQASRGGVRGMSQEEQAEAIAALERGDVNVMVSTSIAEEGLDIPAVDHVVFYEPIPSEIRYIQRRGRTGRRAPGKVTILAAEGTLDEVYLYASTARAKRMRRVMGELKAALRPMLRTEPPPEDPMTEEELRRLDEATGAAAEAEAEEGPAVAATARREERRVSREAARAARRIYSLLLEAGEEGMGREEALMRAAEEGIEEAVAEAALERLVKGRMATRRGDSYVASSAARAAESGEAGREVEIEKVLPGSAVVIVDGKWRARLEPGDFNGPRELIRRGSRFVASVYLYRSGGVLRIRVKEVVRRIR
ncbi:helicase-related protein [Conexivisphaera calida]|uniref:ATP-dependent RNA helicase homolog eIF-4A n=1 Tax=Conexivisphaera calida TaxID=1874277 RepID=A0A4P2VDL5_9ARCH|nr:helicase-related protein [Conexivisphaera calida]BBE42221.1 ATP-dependent RNA helicase homolog eIF-4A [Conexivisphaera calida]